MDPPAASSCTFFGLSWLVAFPTLLFVLPLVRRATAAVVQPLR